MKKAGSRIGWIAAILFAFICFVALNAPAGPKNSSEIAKSKKGAASPAPQPVDEGYTAKIREYTTEPYFTTELVDHLPASTTVPSPEKVLGYVIGTPNKLTYTKDIDRYFRALAAASPRVKVFTTGKSEGGRDFILAVVSDEANIKNLDHLKEITAKLADPRKISDADAEKLVAEGKPFYWLSGSIHSPETGSPEMLMELAYRLAVEETPYIQNIRKNCVVMITPALEVDGRDREVDVYNYSKANPDKQAPPLIYWGNYVQHDNNRDSMSLALALSKEQLRVFLDYHPQVLHDLHESEPYLYASTGTGPYNSWFDPMVIDEWHELAYAEIENFTARGVPGVWTHGFFDGWAPNGMMMTTANAHNSIGRFYETFGNGGADTRERTLGAAETSITWFRPNPPMTKVMWSMRDNTNYEESGALFALNFTANNAAEFLRNFYTKSKRAVNKPSDEGPAAWAIVNDGKRPALAAQLVRLLQEQGAEVQKLGADVQVSEPVSAPAGGGGGRGGRGGGAGAAQSSEASAEGAPARSGRAAGPRKQTITIPAGSYIFRMDQPYSRVVDMMLDTQYYNVNDPQPYDDTGWTFGALRYVKTQRITDASILSAQMTPITGEVHAPGGVTGSGSKYFLVNATAEPALATLRFRLKDVKMSAAEDNFQSGGKDYRAGTFIIASAGNPSDLKSQLDKAASDLGLRVEASDADLSVAQHPISVPRIALVHTWQSTQQEGWFRLALEETGVPYSYISVHTIRDTPNLRDKYDVILFPPAAGGAAALINGIPKRMDADGKEIGGPIPWMKTDLTPNLGTMDSTDDIRGGIELAGVEHLQKFIEDGGVFIPITSTIALPIDTGITSFVSIVPTRGLEARGSVLSATIEDRKSPIAYGYDDPLGVYFSQAPVLRVAIAGGGFGGGGGGRGGEAGGRPSGRGTANDPEVPVGRKWEPPAPEPQRTRAEQELYVNPELPRSAVPPPATWPRVIVRFNTAQNLLISGMLGGGQEMAESPAVVDLPVGRGHVVFFAINPMWRQETHGSFMLVLNTALNFNHLNAGRKMPSISGTSTAEDDEEMYAMPGHQSH